jgi:hypothetical protein
MPEKKKRILTGQAAETGFVTRMGGREYMGRAGSQATDIILNHPEHGTFDGEMKAGGTIDFSQMRMDVDHASGKLRQTIGSVQSSGDVSGQYQKRSGRQRDVVKLAQRITRDTQLTPGTQDIERVSRKTGKVKQETRPAAMGEVPTKRLKLNNRNAVDMMHRADPVHIAIHHKTGEVALIPTKDEHAHLGEKMGLKKTVTYDHLGGEDHGHKNTLGVKLRGPRAKGSTFNASVESSSGAMVDAVRDAGGHVFDSLDHATEHLRGHGWGAETGHAMSESVGLLLQGKYGTRLISEFLVKRVGDAMSKALATRSPEEEEEKKKGPLDLLGQSMCNNQQDWAGTRESDPWKDCPGRYEVTDSADNQDSGSGQTTTGQGGLEQSTTRPDGTPVVPDSDPSGGTSRTGDGAGGTNITNQGTVVGAQGVDNQVGNINTGNVETAYQSQPIGNLSPVGDAKPATVDATPSASYNPPVTGGQVSPSGGVVGVGDPRKRNQPRASAQFQTQGYDFGSMKANFMKESSVQSLLDEILNEKNTELNLKGSFGEPVHDKSQEDKAYIRAALFSAMKKNNK